MPDPLVPKHPEEEPHAGIDTLVAEAADRDRIRHAIEVERLAKAVAHEHPA
jgi:hypothetical protein